MNLMNVRAILFDLHHTLTETREPLLSFLQKIIVSSGINLVDVSPPEFESAFLNSNVLLAKYQLERDVSIHWGTEPRQWIECNRLVFESLGIDDLSDEVILEFERRWKYETRDSDWEYVPEQHIQTLKELHNRGYVLGVCTRRHDDPTDFLNRIGILPLFSTIQWTGVPGYAKPNPYTLLQAAEEIEVNPHLCAFVGNYVSADIEAAIRCEMTPVLLTWANPGEADKAPSGTLVKKFVVELLGVFGKPSD
jgi:phosphoglycolate phosphatase-like HAD superfamily hydrolase